MSICPPGKEAREQILFCSSLQVSFTLTWTWKWNLASALATILHRWLPPSSVALKVPQWHQCKVGGLKVYRAAGTNQIAKRESLNTSSQPAELVTWQSEPASECYCSMLAQLAELKLTTGFILLLFISVSLVALCSQLTEKLRTHTGGPRHKCDHEKKYCFGTIFRKETVCK